LQSGFVEADVVQECTAANSVPMIVVDQSIGHFVRRLEDCYPVNSTCDGKERMGRVMGAVVEWEIEPLQMEMSDADEYCYDQQLVVTGEHGQVRRGKSNGSSALDEKQRAFVVTPAVTSDVVMYSRMWQLHDYEG